MKSADRGRSWEILSADLTRNDKEHQGPGGYPISNEQITAESYNNVFNIEESPLVEGVIWVGSDDGLVHVTRDGGKTWKNVTPKDLPESIINVIEPSPHDPATAYFAAAGYKMNDFSPYIYRTKDYGATWTRIVRGIPANTFARSVREDPDRRGLLYAGTETGLFVSFDDGGMWQALQLNLPEVPITDMRIRQKDLVVSTQGRSLWILDDLTPLHEISAAMAAEPVHLYKPRDAIRNIAQGWYAEGGPGENPPRGVQVNYFLKDAVPDSVPMSMEILDDAGNVIFVERTNDTRPDCSLRPRARTLKRTAGANRWSWNMKVGEFPCVEELTMTTFDLSAYLVKPGRYQARLTVGDRSQTRDFRILIDPRLDGNSANAMADYEEIDRLSRSIYQAAVEMGAGITGLRRVKDQLDVVMGLSEDRDVQAGGKALAEKMDGWIERLLQKELRTFQNHYQFEARQLLKMKDLLDEMGGNELPLGQGYRDVARDYQVIWTGLATQLQVIRNQDIPAFNEVLRRAGLPELYLPRPIS